MTKRQSKTEGQRLVAEFGLHSSVADALSLRIDGLIRIKVSEERHRCSEIAKSAWGETLALGEEAPAKEG